MGRKRKNITPSKLERRMKIAGTIFDRRVKITPEERFDIRRKRCDGASYYRLAKEYGVCHKTIMQICDPTMKNKPSEKSPKANEYLKGCRDYKRKLLIFNKVNLDNIIEKGTDQEFEIKFDF
jgi:hypothetical protein